MKRPQQDETQRCQLIFSLITRAGSPPTMALRASIDLVSI